ncbi:MAG: substrate-binding domain-containing protein [Lentisphaerae bacterium]|jgi:D-xylose transport system substrate-binding protein|nr:substrate-binding domain-containing protein [Lentisphaerota bacterium]MBT5608640.1 substrate-binding domain-containing protein [Lentisphaerota bacterium]MBT7057943.1 substrate-binding domain-containing protein [Lentisphaerota bacterium]MBT7841610.1 substrate-binding domain-containing protein [Lentisphaerota bacterium]
MKHALHGMFCLGLLAAWLPTQAAPRDGKPVKVGFLLETYDVNRWARDEAFFVGKAEEMNAKVMKAVADGDQDRQNKQAESFLVRGADVLVVIPKNLETAGRIVKSAHPRKVPVVAYDRLIRNCDLDVYVTFDNEQVGYLQAKGVLEAVPEGNYILLGGAATDNNARLLRKGQLRAIEEHRKATGKTITVLADPFLDNWDREEARRKVGNMLTRFKAQGKAVQAIVASNDSTAGGAIAALKGQALAGKVAVSGQDAELTACQRVVEGTQTLTVYKPVRLLAEVAAALAVELARGKTAEEAIRELGYTVQLLDNGKRQVPSIFLTPTFVTKANMVKTVVSDDWHPLEKVYKNIPKDQWPK